jgi:hypothetical protein
MEICCPYCSSNQLFVDKKGYSLKKGITGMVLTGGVGLLAGLLGSNKVIITCLSCGRKFKPGDNPTSPSNNAIEQQKNEVFNSPNISEIEFHGVFHASQSISGELCDINCAVHFGNNRWEVRIDGRNAWTSLLLEDENKERFVKILEKSLELDQEAKKTDFDTTEGGREVGEIISNVILIIENSIEFQDVVTTITYHSYYSADSFAFITISTQNFQITPLETLSAAIIMVDISEVPNLISILNKSEIISDNDEVEISPMLKEYKKDALEEEFNEEYNKASECWALYMDCMFTSKMDCDLKAVEKALSCHRKSNNIIRAFFMYEDLIKYYPNHQDIEKWESEKKELEKILPKPDWAK